MLLFTSLCFVKAMSETATQNMSMEEVAAKLNELKEAREKQAKLVAARAQFKEPASLGEIPQWKQLLDAKKTVAQESRRELVQNAVWWNTVQRQAPNSSNEPQLSSEWFRQLQ